MNSQSWQIHDKTCPLYESYSPVGLISITSQAMHASRFLLITFASLSWCLMAHSESLIRFEKIKLEDKFYGEGAAIGDLNKDGKNDVIYGPYWWEGPDFKKKYTYYEPKEYGINGYSDNFFDYTYDFNGDGSPDILVLGFPGKEARLYLNPGKEVTSVSAWKMFVVADVVDNESPEFTDITGDGRAEIVCSKDGQFGYFEPDWQDVTKAWTWHPVTENVGVQKFTHGMGISDVNGDGRMDLLEAKRWWEQPKETQDDKTKDKRWMPHTFQLTGGGGAQMFAYDFNADGRNDIVSSISAHQFGVAWFEQGSTDTPVRAPLWQKHLIVGREPWENEYGVRFSQPHAVALVDVDGDGVKDIITGKRYWAHNGHDPNERDPRIIYWFQTKRLKDGRVEFVPHLMDSDSGVGTQLTTGDVDGDGLVDVVIGNKSGCYVLLQRREEVNAERYAQFQPKKMYGPDRVEPKDYKSGQKAEEAVKGMILPAGFKAELIAAEPDIVQPIAMCWDERGRLWVAEGNSYPQKRNGDKGPDRILIFEDTKGTGKFDKRTVFMEGLNLVSGLEVGFGGVWIGAAPNLLFIPKDANDKPGEPKVLLDGWGMQDTHETLNSFIWGPDGWLYGCHGVFTYSKVGKPGTPEAERTPMNAGVWRYHPVRHEFEVFAHGTSNPWGLDYDENGEFFITACVIPHLYHIVPGGRYQRQGGQHFNPYTYEDIKTIADHAHFAGNISDNAHWGDRHTKTDVPVADDTDQAGGGHAHCGLCIYQGDNFPPEYRGELIFGNLHGHRLVHDHVDPNGGSFTGQHRSDFMRSADHWFIPIQQKVGPDGALYVSDWSDKQVCHQGSNAIGMWDRSNGRIYRISYDQGSAGTPARNADKSGDGVAKKNEADKGVRAPFDLGKMSDVELAKLAVESENVWFERMARKVLMERVASGQISKHEGPTMHPVEDILRTAFGSEHRKTVLRASWALAQVDATGNYRAWFQSPNENIRAWAVRLVANELALKMAAVDISPETTADGGNTKLHPALRSSIERYAGPTLKCANADSSPLVRRELASLLQRLPLYNVWRTSLAKAMLQHKEDEKDPQIPLLVWYGIEPVVAADPQAGLMLANASKWDKITGFIYRRMSVTDAGREAILSEAAKQPAEQREKMLTVLLESARSAGKLVVPKEWTVLESKLRAVEAPANGKNIEAMVNEFSALFGVESAVSKFRESLANSSTPIAERQKALRLLIQVRDVASAKVMQDIISKEEASPLRRACLQGLASIQDAATPGVLVSAYAKLSAEEKNDAVATLASTADGAKALLKAVEDKVVSNQAMTPFLMRQLQALNNTEVNGLIDKVYGTVNASKADLPQRKAKFKAMLTADKIKAADTAMGKQVFAATCGTCHRLFGEGASVGPDLTGSNRVNLDYLLDNVLDPNAVIGKAYQLNLFTMKDGRVLGGIVKEETDAAYRVVMPGGVEFTLTKAEIAKHEVSKFSTMPEGQFDALPPEMVQSLVHYLQSTTGGAQASPAPEVKK